MIDISLNDKSAEDVKYIQELRRLGVPDEMIQIIYERILEKRKENKNV